MSSENDVSRMVFGRGVGRPKLDPKTKRGKNISVWLTPEEYEMVENRKEVSQSFSDFFRELLLNRR